MTQFNTIHIFAYGEVQMIGSTNGKVEASSLSSLQPLVDHIKTLKPNDVLDRPYHAIHISYGDKASYLGKGEAFKENTGFSAKWANLDLSLLGALSDELAAALA